MSMKIALAAGHHPKARGACHHDRCEHEFAAEWCAIIGSLLHDVVEVYHVPTGGLRSVKIPAINEQKCDLAVEIHFNACGDCGASGAETLYCPGSIAGAKAASQLQDAMVKGGASRNRGIKEGWYKMDRDNGPDYFLEATNCPAVILEPEFIEQYHRIEEKRDAMCEAISLGIIDILTGETSNG